MVFMTCDCEGNQRSDVV